MDAKVVSDLWDQYVLVLSLSEEMSFQDADPSKHTDPSTTTYKLWLQASRILLFAKQKTSC